MVILAQKKKTQKNGIAIC